MKNAIIAGLLLAPALSVLAQDNLTIEGRIKGLEAGKKVYFQPLGGSGRDSTVSTAGKFTIRTRIEPGNADMYILQIGQGYTEHNMTLVYLSEGKIKISGDGPDFKGSKASGTPALKDYDSYTKAMDNDPVLKDRGKLYAKANELYRSKDSIAFKALQPELEKMQAASTAFTKNWIEQHPSSQISAHLLRMDLGRDLSMAEQEALFNKLTDEAKNNAAAKNIANSIKAAKITAVGQPAPVFTQNDTLGKAVSLADFRGKYVLVDFWASWCVPCRAENPNVVKAFKKFQSKNFTVLGVSFDQPNGHDKWIKAIHDDGLTWTHVSDLKYWNNAAGKLYDIRAIPANVLVGPDGIIVAKDLHGDELEHKLTELLGPAIEGPFSLNGKTNGLQSGMIYLTYSSGDSYKKDSATIVNGAFTFSGTLKEPSFGGLTLKGEDIYNARSCQVVLEPGTIDVTFNADDPESSTVKGGTVQEELAMYTATQEAVKVKYQDVLDVYKKSADVYTKALRAKKSAKELEPLKEKANKDRDALEPYFEANRSASLAFFHNYPQSYVTAYNLRFSTSDMSADTLKAFYDRLGAEVQQSAYGKNLLEEYKSLKSGSPGSMAAVFSGTDINGKPLSLTDFRGKYVLVDFWASWCVPCRAGNPHLLKLYSQYKSKGFEIIGVSDDDSNPAAWKQAVAKDKIGVWKHILRGLKRTPEGFDRSEDRSEAYGIHTLPTKILIDPDGMIVGRYGGGGEDDDALDRKLSAIFQ